MADTAMTDRIIDLNELAKQLTEAKLRLRDAKAHVAVAESAERSAQREYDIIAQTILNEVQADD